MADSASHSPEHELTASSIRRIEDLYIAKGRLGNSVILWISLAVVSFIAIQISPAIADRDLSATLYFVLMVLQGFPVIGLIRAAAVAPDDLPGGFVSAALTILVALLPFGYWLLVISLSTRINRSISKHGYTGSLDQGSMRQWCEDRLKRIQRAAAPLGTGEAFTSLPEAYESRSGLTIVDVAKKVPKFRTWLSDLDDHLQEHEAGKSHADFDPQRLSYGFLSDLSPEEFLESPETRRRALSTILVHR
ncbi:MAG: hypothetical protein IH944_02670 [Armatimonadetes bacterium]|nr:hypothetical protein [Armatimonadota bacterium]